MTQNEPADMQQDAAEPVDEDGPQAEPEFPEAAPTDFGRNVWLLFIILGVVALAWLVSLLSAAPRRAVEPGAQPPAPGTGQSTARPGQPDPAERRGPPTAQPVTPLRVVGNGGLMVSASPAQKLSSGGPTYRLARLFDVTRRAENFDPGRFSRMPGRWADQKPVMKLNSDEPFRPAAQVRELAADARVVALPRDARTRAYSVESLEGRAGILDQAEGDAVFLCWSPFTQMARCLAASGAQEAVPWADAGLLYRGNEVLYDPPTGSLWDPLTGAALAGPRAGDAARVLPVQIWRWDEFHAQHPDSPVFHIPAGERGAEMRRSRESYLQEPRVPFPLWEFDPEQSPLGPNSFVLGVAEPGAARAYPLARLAQTGPRTFTDRMGGSELELTVGSPRTARAHIGGRPVDAVVMLWAGWKEAHPETDLYQGEGGSVSWEQSGS